MPDTPTNPAAVVEQARRAAATYARSVNLWPCGLPPRTIEEGHPEGDACSLTQAFKQAILLGIEQGRAEMREEADDLLAGAIAYEITKTYVMDVPTARAVIDRARRAIPTAKERG